VLVNILVNGRIANVYYTPRAHLLPFGSKTKWSVELCVNEVISQMKMLEKESNASKYGVP
jgi:hypothetical protein